MRLPRISHPLTATTLVVVIAASAMGVPPVVRAEDQPLLALPAADEFGDHRALVTDDAVRPAPDVFDVDAAGAAALDQVDLFDVATWDISELAASLRPEPGTAFEWVRDSLAFDPYPGVLRGAHGALVARAGNAWDRALLLQALLREGGHETRLAMADLDEEAAAAVVERALDGAVELVAGPDVAELLGLDVEAIATRARRDHALLLEALGEELSAAGVAGTASAQDALGPHAWVQLRQDDGSWIDLDPTLPSMQPGDRLVEAATTLDEPPADLHHALVVRVVTEMLTDGVVAESVALEHRLDAATAADSEIWLTFQPEAGGLGGSLFDALGEVGWVPVLSVDGDDVAGTAFQIGGGGDASDFLFGGGSELTALRLELLSEAPGLEPLGGERLLLDRVAPADRASGTIVPELLEPLPPAGQPLPALAGIHQIMVSNGAADLRAHAVNRAIALGYGSTLVNDPAAVEGLALPDLLYPLAVANQSIVAASERLLTDGVGRTGEARAYVGRPRGYLVSLLPYPAVPDGTAIVTDLALDTVEVVLDDDAPPSLEAQVRLWHGVLQTALETELSLARTRAVSPDSAAVDSVSLRMDEPLTLVRPDDIERIDPGAGALRATLEQGQLALVVGGPAAGAFWAVEPASGRTRSVLEPGLRVGFTWGRNYVNSSAGGPRYVIDPKTGNTLGTIRDGRFTPANRRPPSRCSGGTEYVVILGCVSIPASMTVGLATATVITAIVAWATVLLELLLL